MGTLMDILQKSLPHNQNLECHFPTLNIASFSPAIDSFSILSRSDESWQFTCFEWCIVEEKGVLLHQSESENFQAKL